MRTKALSAALIAALSLGAIPTISAANSSVGFTISIGKSNQHHGHRNTHHRKHTRPAHKQNYSRFAPAHERPHSAPRVKHHSPGPLHTLQFLGLLNR